MAKQKTIKHKKIKGQVTVLKALPYKDCMVYIRRVKEDIFEYLLVFEKQIFSSYYVIKPKKGETKLSEDEISQISGLLWTGAESTIDTLLGVELSAEDKQKVKAFEETIKLRKAVEV